MSELYRLLAGAGIQFVENALAKSLTISAPSVAGKVGATDLASHTDPSKGAGIPGFSWALTYGQLSSGWGIRSSASYQNVLRWITPSLWAAILDGTTTTDVSSMVQLAIDEIAAAGGGTLYIPGVVLCNTPLRLIDGVDLVGCGRNHAKIKKDSTTTKACTIVAGALVVYGGSALPEDLNAILILDGPGGRYTGRISDITLEGTLATAGNFESQKVEFGIVAVGSVSDYTRERVNIVSVQYAEVYPVIFASELRSSRWSTCLKGLSIDNGTSLQGVANYANDCRDWGYFIRDVKYSEITGNACDNLNDPAKYPTRTRTCSAYKLRSLLCCVVTDNGDEQTYGRSIELDEFDRSLLEYHTTIDIGSDYTGADQIAWIYSSDLLRGSTVRNNFAYGVKAGGLTYGGASAAAHHNIYFTGLTNVSPEQFYNNMVVATRTSTTEAGWGNNVPTTWLNTAKGGALVYTHSPTLSAQTPGNLAVVYGADNKHYIEQKGALRHVWGCFHVTVTHTTASGLLVIDGFPTNGSLMSAIDVVGLSGGSGLAVKLGWFEMAAAATGAVGRSDGDVNFVITDLPTGTTVRIFYDGWYSTG